MVEKTYYYMINRSLEELVLFLKDLSNQAIHIPGSRIVGIMAVSDDTWIIVMKSFLLRTVKIPLKRELRENSIVFYSNDNNLIIRYDLHRVSDDSSILSLYIKAVDKLATTFGPEIDLMDQRLVESLKIRYRDISVTRIDQKMYTSLLEYIRTKSSAEKTVEQEIVSKQESGQQTPIEVIDVTQTTQSTQQTLKIEEIIPLTGSSESREETEKSSVAEARTEPSASAVRCSDCIFYEENTRYCVLLMKRIEDLNNPLCGGSNFIKRSS